MQPFTRPQRKSATRWTTIVTAPLTRAWGRQLAAWEHAAGPSKTVSAEYQKSASPVRRPRKSATAAPTTTTTAGPTTTTTSAPVLRVDPSYTVLCAGGGSSISAITYTGGTNICDSASINAISFNPYPAGRYYLYISTLGYVEYNKPGGIGTSLMNKVGAGCTVCPAPTTTTTNPGYYYNVTRYACNTCTLLNVGLIGFSSTPLINNYYYNNGDGLGVYYVVSSTSIGTIDVNLNLSYGNATCNTACII